MAGTKAGGIKAAQVIKQRHGEDYYRKIGYIGGKASEGGGFTNNPELASRAGKIGGAKSRKLPRNITEGAI